MDGDVRLQNDGSVEIVGKRFRADVGFDPAALVELTGTRFKTAVTDLELLFRGGALRSSGGSVELGSRDSGAFKGVTCAGDGSVSISADRVDLGLGAVKVHGVRKVRPPGGPVQLTALEYELFGTLDGLVQQVAALQQTVAALTARVATLEKRS